MAEPADSAGESVARGTQRSSTVLDLYNLAVEMADRVSARRGAANTFFLTVNTGLAALLGGANLRWYVAVAGIVFALAWWVSLLSYERLNAAKFAVILAMEEELPVKVFTDEWAVLKQQDSTGGDSPRGRAAWFRRYLELGAVERVAPLAFVVIYVAELIRQAAG